jgi:hypothetical protein
MFTESEFDIIKMVHQQKVSVMLCLVLAEVDHLCKIKTIAFQELTSEVPHA